MFPSKKGKSPSATPTKKKSNDDDDSSGSETEDDGNTNGNGTPIATPTKATPTKATPVKTPVKRKLSDDTNDKPPSAEKNKVIKFNFVINN